MNSLDTHHAKCTYMPRLYVTRAMDTFYVAPKRDDER